VRLPISFPSEREQLCRQLWAMAGATAEERLQAVADTLSAVEALSAAGGPARSPDAIPRSVRAPGTRSHEGVHRPACRQGNASA
jgi:hypothetical protein